MVLEYWQKAVFAADLADWVTIAAYLLAAILAWRAARFADPSSEQRIGFFWRASAIVLVLLGINELLDLQALLTALGKAHAQANGWYDGRRAVQFWFVVALGIAGVIAGAAVLWLTRAMGRAVQLALLGFLSIGLFIMLRAASFHHVDMLLGSGYARFNWGSVQEMLGIVLIAAAALIFSHRRGEASF